MKQKHRWRWKKFGWVVVALVLLLAGIPTTVQARPPIENSFKALFIAENADVEYITTPANREKSKMYEDYPRSGSFSVYDVPKNLTKESQGKKYIQEERRLYCIEVHGPARFIMGDSGVVENQAIYREEPRVKQAAFQLFNINESNFEWAGRALYYSTRAGESPKHGQNIVYLGLNQGIATPKIYRPKQATDTYAMIHEKNGALFNAHQDYNRVLDILSESLLAPLRAKVRPKVSTMTVTAPGEHTFPAVEGYAIAGMKAASKKKGLTISAEAQKPLSRATLQKKDSYVPTFTIDQNAPDGTYTFTVTRPDLSPKPTWTTYASTSDLSKSAQWLGSVDMKPGEIVDTFTVHYTKQETKPKESEKDVESQTPVPAPVEPEEKPEPQPEPAPEPKPEPVPEPKPEPKPEPAPEPKPEPQPAPKPEPQPAPKSETPCVQGCPNTDGATGKKMGPTIEIHANPVQQFFGKIREALSGGTTERRETEIEDIEDNRIDAEERIGKTSAKKVSPDDKTITPAHEADLNREPGAVEVKAEKEPTPAPSVVGAGEERPLKAPQTGDSLRVLFWGGVLVFSTGALLWMRWKMHRRITINHRQ